ncbi:MAG TPA: mismatch-specific DNA-glycosylase [Stellaceae bacterium]|nr:mismatch-specific DNA-glycosylase [Stellaceae bacterium]
MPTEDDIATLPDLLRDELEVVFVGINPSIFSAWMGHYFARPSNRFWRALSRSVLSRSARDAMGVTLLTPAQDRALLDHGFGFTDLVKRPTARAAEVAPAEFAAGIAALRAKLEKHRPRIACFQGITGYRALHGAIASGAAEPGLGLQPTRIAATRLFVAPSPSGANAHATPAILTEWYDRLAACLGSCHTL